MENTCAACNKPTPGYDIVHFNDPTSPRILCTYCYNATMAASCGLDGFHNARFEPLDVVDQNGLRHVFHFRYRLFVTGVSLDAFELSDDTPSGYQFRVIGEPEDEPFEVLGRLVKKIKGALSTRHLEETPHGLLIADHGIVRGNIECDLDDPYRQMPLLIIDGQEITWAEFGQILTSYEGWRFKLKILERDQED
jgi:hypothetical protein